MLLEVKEHCSFADYFIICSGASKRQVSALAEHLKEELAQAGVKPLGVEGMQEGLWVLMDYNTLVIHIFFHELGDFTIWKVCGPMLPRPPTAPSSPAAMLSPPRGAESASESGIRVSGHE